MFKGCVIMAMRGLLLLLITAISLELLLQLGFPQLPKAVIEQMPQYLERIGYRLNTRHGARQPPAAEIVEYEVTPLSGDLYHSTCISPADALPFEPYRVSFKRDNHGFRNPEPWPDDLDLVVLGDSFTAAEQIQRPFWQDLSESMLVLAVPGSGTLEQQRLFDAFALPRTPETVVLAFFAGNDLHDNRTFANMIYRERTWHDVVHLRKNALDYSVLFQLLQLLSDAARPTDESACHYPLIAGAEPPTPVVFFRGFLPQLRLDRENLIEFQQLPLTRSSVSDMVSALPSADGRLILMYIPTKLEMYWSYLDEETKDAFIATESREYNVSGLEHLDANLHVQRQIMRELANEVGALFLDLTPPLDEAIRAGQSPYFFADTHWNQLGHDIARNALLDFLNRSNLEA